MCSMDDKVVSSFGFTHGQLNEAFELIKNARHWKLSIDAWIHPNKFDICNEACIYFTGGPLKKAQWAGDGALRVTSPGYFYFIDRVD